MENIDRIKRILEDDNFGENSINALVCYVSELEDALKQYNSELASGLFENFLNYDTLNYISD